MTLYMFRKVFPSFISSRPYMQQKAFVRQILLGRQQYLYSTVTGICQTDTAVCFLASRQQYLFDKCLLLYVRS